MVDLDIAIRVASFALSVNMRASPLIASKNRMLLLGCQRLPSSARFFCAHRTSRLRAFGLTNRIKAIQVKMPKFLIAFTGLDLPE
jgi:hypothetical protein